jgi:hypothetical protein
MSVTDRRIKVLIIDNSTRVRQALSNRLMRNGGHRHGVQSRSSQGMGNDGAKRLLEMQQMSAATLAQDKVRLRRVRRAKEAIKLVLPS